MSISVYGLQLKGHPVRIALILPMMSTGERYPLLRYSVFDIYYLVPRHSLGSATLPPIAPNNIRFDSEKGMSNERTASIYLEKPINPLSGLNNTCSMKSAANLSVINC